MAKDNNYKAGFSVGIINLRYGDVDACKERLKEELEIEHRQSLEFYINGKTTISRAKALIIEKVFSEFGIKDPEKIWGKTQMPKSRIQKSILARAKTA